MIYNPDVTHCSGYKCPFAETCVRAKLGAMWQDLPDEVKVRNNTPFILSSAYKDNHCKLYLKDE